MKSQEIKFQKHFLSELNLGEDELVKVSLYIKNGVYEDILVYDRNDSQLEMNCTMEWNEGDFECQIPFNELKNVLSQIPLYEIDTYELDNYSFEVLETRDGVLNIHSVNGKEDPVEIAEELKGTKYAVPDDTAKEDLLNIVEERCYRLYREGDISDSEYRFRSLQAIKIGGVFISDNFWDTYLYQAKNEHRKDDPDYSLIESLYDKFLEWEINKEKKAEVYFHQGELKYELEKWEDAINLYLKAINNGYSKVEAYQSLGWAYRKTNQIDESIKSYEKATQIDPESESAFYMLGVLKAHKGQSDEALEAYSKTVELNPENADAYMRRGDLYIKKGKLENAKSDFQKCISIDDTKAYSFYRLGLVNKELKEFEKSAKNLGKALHLNGKMQKDDGIWGAKGWCEFKSKQYDEAVKSYSQALKLNKKAAYHYWRGNSYLEKGSSSFAIEDLKLSIKLNKSNKFSFYKLGVAYKHKGETESALEALNKAVEIDPGFKAAKLEIEKIR